MESIISTFHIDWKIIIAQAINFGIVFVVLYIYALKPLSKLMTERSDRIARGLSDAKSNEELLKRAKEEHAEALRIAKDEAGRIIKDARKEAEVKKNEMMESAKVEVAGMIDAGKKTLQAEKTKMVEDAKTEITSLAVMAAEKVLKSKQDLNNL